MSDTTQTPPAPERHFLKAVHDAENTADAMRLIHDNHCEILATIQDDAKFHDAIRIVAFTEVSEKTWEASTKKFPYIQGYCAALLMSHIIPAKNLLLDSTAVILFSDPDFKPFHLKDWEFRAKFHQAMTGYTDDLSVIKEALTQINKM